MTRNYSKSSSWYVKIVLSVQVEEKKNFKVASGAILRKKSINSVISHPMIYRIFGEMREIFQFFFDLVSHRIMIIFFNFLHFWFNEQFLSKFEKFTNSFKMGHFFVNFQISTKKFINFIIFHCFLLQTFVISLKLYKIHRNREKKIQ